MSFFPLLNPLLSPGGSFLLLPFEESTFPAAAAVAVPIPPLPSALSSDFVEFDLIILSPKKSGIGMGMGTGMGIGIGTMREMGGYELHGTLKRFDDGKNLALVDRGFSNSCCCCCCCCCC